MSCRLFLHRPGPGQRVLLTLGDGGHRRGARRGGIRKVPEVSNRQINRQEDVLLMAVKYILMYTPYGTMPVAKEKELRHKRSTAIVCSNRSCILLVQE